MKTYESYQAELEELKAQLRSSIFYLALPAAFLADAKADGTDHFYMIMPNGVRPITLQKWDEVAQKPDTEVYSMPQLSPKTERLYFENSAKYLEASRWASVANAVSNHTSPAKLNAEDTRLFNYLMQLSKNELNEFVQVVSAQRKTDAKLKRQQYKRLMAQREAMQNAGQKKKCQSASDHIEPPADETPEERVARISRQIDADFDDDDFTPFW